MKYKAEIFDKAQYLFDITGYNDHQIRCVISFDGKIDCEAMKEAARKLLKAAPMLARVYKNYGGTSFWEDTGEREFPDLFTIVYDKKDFERFTVSKTDAEKGPQIRFCVLSAENDSLSVIINHMVSDGAGFKQCVYLLAEIYSKLIKNPYYEPDFIIDGDRSFKPVLHSFGTMSRLRLFFSGGKDNNQKSDCEFPFDMKGETEPFIIAHSVPPDTYTFIYYYCKKMKVTMNDLIMTAYLRSLSKMPELINKEIDIAFMIDMRRYLEDKSLASLTNLSATSILKYTVKPGEDFATTLREISAEMKRRKSDNIGINTFLKLEALFRLLPKTSYGLLKNGLQNPKLGITNIGLLDPSSLAFGTVPVSDAYMCPSIKYRPHFQIAVTSFKDKMTICVNIYGSQKDRDNFERFLKLMDNEFEAIKIYPQKTQC